MGCVFTYAGRLGFNILLCMCQFENKLQDKVVKFSLVFFGRRNCHWRCRNGTWGVALFQRDAIKPTCIRDKVHIYARFHHIHIDHGMLDFDSGVQFLQSSDNAVGNWDAQCPVAMPIKGGDKRGRVQLLGIIGPVPVSVCGNGLRLLH